jgi:arginine/lysine/histidine transporter system substrate-binding protein
MKKLMALLLTGTMVFSLAACSQAADTAAEDTTETTEENAEETTEETAEEEETAEDVDAAAEESSTVDLSGSKYLSDGELTVALNATFPPFEYVGDGTDTFEAITSNESDVTGFDVAMMNEIGKRLGVNVVIEDMDFDGIVAAIGVKVDCAATGMTITDERKESVNFSDSYYNATQAVLLPVSSDIKTAEDLAAASAIGVQAGTTGEIVAREINDSAVVSVKSFNQAVLDLVNGKDDAVVIDQVPGEAFAAQYSDKLQLVDGSEFDFDEEQYGIAMPKDDEVMLEAINNALAEMKADGTYDTLVEQYINSYEAE